MSLQTVSLIEKIQETPTDWSFRFTKPEGYVYEAGQYNVLRMPMLFVDDRHGARTCTLSSSPTESFLQYTFTMRDTGFKKTLMQMPVGTQAQITPARGGLVLSKVQTRKLCMIAGGIGVAPFRSIAKYMADAGVSTPEATLIYSDKDHHEIAFLDEWANFGHLSLLITLTRADESLNWSGNRGRISWELIKSNHVCDQDTSYMICGSPEMVRSVQEMLVSNGVDNSKVLQELFTGY